MANTVFNEAKRAIMAAEIDFDAPNDFRVALVMTNTTTDTEVDVNLMNGFTTLDELNDGSYVRQALASETLSEDAGNNRAEFDANDAAFVFAGDGTRNTKALIMFKQVTNDTDSVPLLFVDTGGFPITNTQVGTVTITWNAQGILQLA